MDNTGPIGSQNVRQINKNVRKHAGIGGDRRVFYLHSVNDDPVECSLLGREGNILCVYRGIYRRQQSKLGYKAIKILRQGEMLDKLLCKFDFLLGKRGEYW